MSLPQNSRWHLRIISKRWRRAFWLITLFGLLAGLSVHFYPYLTRNTAKGQILVSTIPKAGHRTSIKSTTRLAAVTLRSDVVLAQTMIDLNLPEEWGMEGEECVSRLEDRVFSRRDPKTGLVMLSVKGHSRSEAIRIWDKLIELAGDELIRLEKPVLVETLKALETEINTRQKSVNSTRKALGLAMAAEAYARRHQKVDGPDTVPVLPDRLPNFPGPGSNAYDVEKALSEHKQAVAALETAQARMAAETKTWSSIERPFIVQAAPSISTPDSVSLLSIVKHSTLGLAAGLILALILACLLELLFPRKASAS